MTGDLAFAATSFEVATMLAAMTNGTPRVGVGVRQPRDGTAAAKAVSRG